MSLLINELMLIMVLFYLLPIKHNVVKSENKVIFYKNVEKVIK